jgi:hypothetical protein
VVRGTVTGEWIVRLSLTHQTAVSVPRNLTESSESSEERSVLDLYCRAHFIHTIFEPFVKFTAFTAFGY